MRFDCGETWQEREARINEWHRWFAWRPVRVGPHDCRWLEVVERKITRHYTWGGGFTEREYRAIN